jgi:hypothetical protein
VAVDALGDAEGERPCSRPADPRSQHRHFQERHESRVQAAGLHGTRGTRRVHEEYSDVVAPQLGWRPALRRAAAYFAQDALPKMMFPLVQDLAECA